jgi:2-dehydro-3-deoxy-D-arabinonate dehydratase
MKIIHYHDPDRGGGWGIVEDDRVHPLASDAATGGAFLASLLQWPDPARVLLTAREAAAAPESYGFEELLRAVPNPGRPHLLPPLDRQEVWAAGVTYLRSKTARMEESEGAARFYDLVYDADRPELFFKALPDRVVGPGGSLRIRSDAAWNVPEPEFTVLFSPRMEILGYTLGNDMSSRDIEGANPLYLPQAKVYRQSCALGPALWVPERSPGEATLSIEITIERAGARVFEGRSGSDLMRRGFAELGRWLGRENWFPHGVYLMTGTGVVPGDEFTLKSGDLVEIFSPEIGHLRNPVIQREAA